MYNPVMDYTFIASGVIMMCASTLVIHKVYKGSKSSFAYVLLAFTFFDGAQYLFMFFIS